jgi:TRAP transporter TAXI family solute receptor
MLAFLSLMLVSVTVEAQSRDDVNRGTVGVISGPVSGTYARFAQDLSDVLDDPGRIRVIAVLGKGSHQNVMDLLYLHGIDVAIVQSDVLNQIRDDRRITNIKRQISYITWLYDEELHILARPEITSLTDLAGKRVNIGQEGSGTAYTISTVFDALRISVDHEYMPDNMAVEALKKGEVSAAAFVAGKPFQLLRNIPSDFGLHLLEVPMLDGLANTYVEGTLTEQDYSNLIRNNIVWPPEQGPQHSRTIKTIAVGAILAIYNHQVAERQEKVNKFVEEFSKVLPRLKHNDGFHEKWKDVDVKRQVPGWTQYKIAPTSQRLR